jgi:sigma-E factor negative regulatory protein RseC
MRVNSKENEGGILEHKGVVIALNHGWVDVAMQVESACIGCKVRGACGMADQKEKLVSVAADISETYSVGEEVIVSIGRSMGFRALFLSYVIPLVLLLVSLLALLGAGVGEGVAGLSSLGVLAIYYLILWLFRNRIRRKIIFKIRKIQ